MCLWFYQLQSQNIQVFYCGEYFYFHRSFTDTIKDIEFRDGINIDGINIDGINRYALFLEGELYIEMENEFSLTDVEIEKMYPESCIIICYSTIHNKTPDVLVKDYNNFISISYHMIDKRINKTKNIR